MSCKPSKQEKMKRQKVENIVNELCKRAKKFRESKTGHIESDVYL